MQTELSFQRICCFPFNVRCSISGQKQSDNIYYIYTMWLQPISVPKITIDVSILIGHGKQSLNNFQITSLKDMMLNKPEVPGYWLTVYEETHLPASKVLQQIRFCCVAANIASLWLAGGSLQPQQKAATLWWKQCSQAVKYAMGSSFLSFFCQQTLNNSCTLAQPCGIISPLCTM